MCTKGHILDSDPPPARCAAKQTCGMEPKPQVGMLWLPSALRDLACFPVSLHIGMFCFPPASSVLWFSTTSVTGWMSSLCTALGWWAVVSLLSLLKLLLLTELSSGTLVSDHLCALPVMLLGWTHYRFTWPHDFLSLGVMQWHTCAVFQASLELLECACSLAHYSMFFPPPVCGISEGCISQQALQTRWCSSIRDWHRPEVILLTKLDEFILIKH